MKGSRKKAPNSSSRTKREKGGTRMLIASRARILVKIDVYSSSLPYS